jgi:hypothetical protein
MEQDEVTKIYKKIGFAAVAAMALASLQAHGQDIGANRSIVRNEAVQYLSPEQVTVPAGKPTPVNLHFKIAPGLHINSHTPSEDYLIPTTFSIPGDTGVKLDKAIYPAGADLVLPIDPKTKLSVYTGEFVIQARIIAAPGNHLVEATLHFQACNESQCLPPKTIPVAIDVMGK